LDFNKHNNNPKSINDNTNKSKNKKVSFESNEDKLKVDIRVYDFNTFKHVDE